MKAIRLAGLPDGDYEADLHPLNPGVQEHSDIRGVAHGKAYFSVRMASSRRR